MKNARKKDLISNPWWLLIPIMGLITACAAGNRSAAEERPSLPVVSATASVISTTAVPITITPLMVAEPTLITQEQPSAAEGNADVLFVRALETAVGVWTFHVTVAHPDTGWEDYADGWDVMLPDGTVLLPDPAAPYTRLLLHPHETEQPFTRSQSNIIIPVAIGSVTVRAHDLVAGFGGEEIVLDLTRTTETDLYTVVRFSE